VGAGEELAKHEGSLAGEASIGYCKKVKIVDDHRWSDGLEEGRGGELRRALGTSRESVIMPPKYHEKIGLDRPPQGWGRIPGQSG